MFDDICPGYNQASNSGGMSMLSRQDILEAALRLPGADRLVIVNSLMDTLPADPDVAMEDDPEFLAELDRRANDPVPNIPAADIWNGDD
jgi:hypothetical protein